MATQPGEKYRKREVIVIGRNTHTFEKRRRELEKKQKQEAKKLKKEAKKNGESEPLPEIYLPDEENDQLVEESSEKKNDSEQGEQGDR